MTTRERRLAVAYFDQLADVHAAALALLHDDALFRGAFARALNSVRADNGAGLNTAVNEALARARATSPVLVREFPGRRLESVIYADIAYAFALEETHDPQLAKDIARRIMPKRVLGTSLRELRAALGMPHPRGRPPRIEAVWRDGDIQDTWPRERVDRELSNAAQRLARDGGSANVTAQNLAGAIVVPEKTLRRWFKRWGTSLGTVARELRAREMARRRR